MPSSDSPSGLIISIRRKSKRPASKNIDAAPFAIAGATSVTALVEISLLELRLSRASSGKSSAGLSWICAVAAEVKLIMDMRSRCRG